MAIFKDKKPEDPELSRSYWQDQYIKALSRRERAELTRAKWQRRTEPIQRRMTKYAIPLMVMNAAMVVHSGVTAVEDFRRDSGQDALISLSVMGACAYFGTELYRDFRSSRENKTAEAEEILYVPDEWPEEND